MRFDNQQSDQRPLETKESDRNALSVQDNQSNLSDNASSQHVMNVQRYLSEQSLEQVQAPSCTKNCAVMCSNQADLLT